MVIHWLFCIKYQDFVSTCGACLEVVFEVNEIEVQAHFSTLGMPD